MRRDGGKRVAGGGEAVARMRMGVVKRSGVVYGRLDGARFSHRVDSFVTLLVLDVPRITIHSSVYILNVSWVAASGSCGDVFIFLPVGSTCIRILKWKREKKIRM